MVTEDEEGKLPPGWEIFTDMYGETRYYDNERKLETLQRPPKDWVPDPVHAHCVRGEDPFCTDPHHIPTRRPLAEPPMLDYDTFLEKTLPSDRRFLKLIPDDIEKRTSCRDHETERLLLIEYREWVGDMRDCASNGDPARWKFYQELYQDIVVERDAVWDERTAAFQGAEVLALWEYYFLDQDGETKGIQAWSEAEWKGYCNNKAAWIKYGSLAPTNTRPTNWHWYHEMKGIDCICYKNEELKEEEQQSRLALGECSTFGGSVFSEPKEPALESSDESSEDVPSDGEALVGSDEEEEQQREPEGPLIVEAEFRNEEEEQQLVWDAVYML